MCSHHSRTCQTGWMRWLPRFPTPTSSSSTGSITPTSMNYPCDCPVTNVLSLIAFSDPDRASSPMFSRNRPRGVLEGFTEDRARGFNWCEGEAWNRRRRRVDKADLTAFTQSAILYSRAFCSFSVAAPSLMMARELIGMWRGEY